MNRSQLTRDYLVDGYISYAFNSRNAELYVVHLFKTDAASVQAIRDGNGAYSVFIPPSHFSPPVRTQYGDTWVLDYAVRTGGSVVPQQIWAPQGQGDRRRYVDQAQFCMPIFFVNRNGNLGVPVMNAAAGQMHLRDAHLPSSLIDKTSAKIRIGVCAWCLLSYLFTITYHMVSQWPRYAPSEHQVQFRDRTPAKTPIPFDRFVKHVGSRVRQFLAVRLSWMWRRISEIKRSLGLRALSCPTTLQLDGGTWQYHPR
jgi:hypothetical protein